MKNRLTFTKGLYYYSFIFYISFIIGSIYYAFVGIDFGFFGEVDMNYGTDAMVVYAIVKVICLWWFYIAPVFSSYSNPILYEKGFGYVFCLQEVLRREYAER